jgi:hypothetical protein
MSGNVALAVAIVGVVGTLTAAVLSQLFVMRMKQQDIDEQRHQRHEERKEERWRTVFKDRRDVCVALNTEIRLFEQALRSCLSEGLDGKSAELEQAWHAVTSRYSEAQIVLPGTVATAAGDAYGELKYTYDRLRAMEPAEREKLQSRLDERVMGNIRRLRKAMREDLGISDLPLKEL